MIKAAAASIALVASLVAGAASNPLDAWDNLEKKVRDGKMKRPVAQKVLKATVDKLKKTYSTIIKDDTKKKWVYPAREGNYKWTGGTHGEGFRLRSPRPAYDWYHGNKHGGHPGHDIFIFPDKNRDCLDDVTGKAFNAQAMQTGVVVSINEKHKPGNPRGGKYVWMYNPHSNLFAYYAHLTDVFVKPGDIVKEGGLLGTIGKTGFRLSKLHKPCHIHLMVLKNDGYKMKPHNFYNNITPLSVRKKRGRKK